MDEYDEDNFPSTVAKLHPCGICGRTFNPQTLKRHEGICQKTAAKRRKPFDSQNQRAVPDVAAVPKRLTKPKETSTSKSSWRQKHQEFIHTVRAARGITKAIKEGKELPPPPPPATNPDYVQCPYCMRRFNEHSAQRHIKFCADQHKRLETRTKPKAAAEKQERRITYRPPMPSSGLRRTVTLSNGSTSGYSSSSSSQARGQKPSKQSVKSTERTNIVRNRRSDNSSFDTTLPASGVVKTRTGLKARLLASNSTSDIESSDHDAPGRLHGRRTTSTKSTDFQSHYQPTVKTGGARDKHTSYTSVKRDSGFNFDESGPEILKQNGVRKVANSRTRQQSYGNKNGGYSSSSASGLGQHSSDSKQAYEDSLNDFVAREFGSKHKTSTGSHYNGMRTFETSPFSDFTKDEKYTGQGEPGHVVSKDASFVSDGSRDRVIGRNPTSIFCHECGTRHAVATAKFCCQCGMKRIFI